MFQHYRTLQVKNFASNEEIKKAYKRLVLKYHPDKGGDTEYFQRIVTAYKALLNNTEYSVPIFMKGNIGSMESF